MWNSRVANTTVLSLDARVCKATVLPELEVMVDFVFCIPVSVDMRNRKLAQARLGKHADMSGSAKVLVDHALHDLNRELHVF